MLLTLSRYFMLPWYYQPYLDTLCCLDTVNVFSIFYVALILSALSRLVMLPWNCQLFLDYIKYRDKVDSIKATLSNETRLTASRQHKVSRQGWQFQGTIKSRDKVDRIKASLDAVNLISCLMLPWYYQLCLDTLCCFDSVNLVSIIYVALILSTLSR
jgi:hypothetical protein